MKIYKLIFIKSLILGTIVSISAYSWFPMWMGLEINMLSIIPLMASKKNIYSSESSMKYFIVQAMASLIILMSAMLTLLENDLIPPQMSQMTMMMMNSALLTKLGAAPFHFWFPEVMEGLSWMNCLIILTWQKVAPFMLIMNNGLNQLMASLVILSCLMISTIMVMNQTSLRKIMAFSSINHIAWMIAALNSSLSSWTIYFVTYCLMNSSIAISFHKFKLFQMTQLFSTMNTNKQMKTLTILNFLSLAGIPPFIGFLPKWLVIQSMNTAKLHTLALILIMSTLIIMFIYIRISFSSLTLTNDQTKLAKTKNSKTISIINYLIASSLVLSTIMFNLM
uniref:NADH dehydrogenase subunit 2 n=1 Tax=Chlorophila portschinski TaxID=2969964 RepID=UPI002176C9FA|nr:NADH dehydrogenase subunit 2 [Chlorophila portschinski]UUL71652.1 NADH dehydrogenase subunit 2 [Chlorophila portschinski]